MPETETERKAREFFNKQLGVAYFRAAAQYTSDISCHVKNQRAVEESPVDITAFYDAHGSLRDLKVKGIGPKTRHILEVILEEGREGRGVIGREKEEGIHPQPKDRHAYDPKEELPRFN